SSRRVVAAPETRHSFSLPFLRLDPSLREARWAAPEPALLSASRNFPLLMLSGGGAEEGVAMVDHHHRQLDGSAPELYQKYLVPAITTKWTEDLIERAQLSQE